MMYFFHADCKTGLNKMESTQASVKNVVTKGIPSQGHSIKKVTRAATEALVRKAILRVTNIPHENSNNIP